MYIYIHLYIRIPYIVPYSPKNHRWSGTLMASSGTGVTRWLSINFSLKGERFSHGGKYLTGHKVGKLKIMMISVK